MKRDLIRNVIIWLVIAVILAAVFNEVNLKKQENLKISYSELIKNITDKKVSSVNINANNIILGKLSDGKSFESYMPIYDATFLPNLLKNNIEISGTPLEKKGFFYQLLIQLIPLLLLIAFFIFIFRQQTGGGRGGGGAFSFGKSKARLLKEGQIKKTFNDVAGCDEAKEEVKELVDFLKNPKKFHDLGCRIPRGVLLIGQPGTGKTLLAKAIAGEAKVAFFSISGSDFVEMFVGVGASRVRDLFEQAKKHKACIIFIDELDAVGRHRGTGIGGGHDEREQTLNQLLVEMDGFIGKEGIIVLAATNRPDVLDPALLRPGRFDRQVIVSLPDIKGREEIIKIYLKKIKITDNIDPLVIARGTPGFSGADLENLVNEAALICGRLNKKKIDNSDLDQAKDKILIGVERRSMIMSEDEKKITAYHEAGHTIVGRLVPEHDPVYKVTIIPRGQALGVTVFLPQKDRYSLTKSRLHSMLKSLFGGRIAEELIFGQDHITTGAANDISHATILARKMVMKWGLSEKMGPILYGEEEREVFLGQSFASTNKKISDQTVKLVDLEVKKIIDDNYLEAKTILEKNIKILHMMAKALIKYETLDNKQIDDLMKGKNPKPPKNLQAKKRVSKKRVKTESVETKKKSDDKNQNKKEGKKVTIKRGILRRKKVPKTDKKSS